METKASSKTVETKKVKGVSSQEVSRPWEGTVLGILNIIGLFSIMLLMGLLAIALVFGGALIASGVEGDFLPMITAFLGFGALAFIPLIAIFIFGFFITRGIFKGKKWAIIISIIFTVLALLVLLFDFSSFSLIIDGFILFLEIMCLKHSFYNRK